MNRVSSHQDFESAESEKGNGGSSSTARKRGQGTRQVRDRVRARSGDSEEASPSSRRSAGRGFSKSFTDIVQIMPEVFVNNNARTGIRIARILANKDRVKQIVWETVMRWHVVGSEGGME